MTLISNFSSIFSIDKITKKTFAAMSIIIFKFFNQVNEINMIIQATLLTLVFVVMNMLYNTRSIDLNDNIIKNCIGMLSFITLVDKTGYILSPDIIIDSINNFISNTNIIAEAFMDGNNREDLNIKSNTNADTNGTTNINTNPNNSINRNLSGIELNKNNMISIQTQTNEKPKNLLSKSIIKTLLQKVISKL